MQVGLMRVAEARRISQALVTAHITDTSRRSPSGVMLRASQGRPRYAGRPTVVSLSTCRSHINCFHGKEIKPEF